MGYKETLNLQTTSWDLGSWFVVSDNVIFKMSVPSQGWNTSNAKSERRIVLPKKIEESRSRAVGPASMIKHFLVEAENSVLKKLAQEAEFDRIVTELLDEWIHDDNAKYSFDDTRIIAEEHPETDNE